MDLTSSGRNSELYLTRQLRLSEAKFTSERNALMLTISDTVRINVLEYETNPITYFTKLKRVMLINLE